MVVVGDVCLMLVLVCYVFFFQAEDGIRYLVRSRGLGDVYKRQKSKSVKKSRGWPMRPWMSVASMSENS